MSIAQKVELPQKFGGGVSVRCLTEEYGMGTTTIYDKQKDKFLKFYGDSDDQVLVKNRKTFHRTKNKDLDCVLTEWIQQQRSQVMPRTAL